MDAILYDAIKYNGGGINSLLNRGTVKSVQKGESASEISIPKNTNDFYSYYINISPVDLSKAILVSDFWNSNHSGEDIVELLSVVLENNRIHIKLRNINVSYDETITLYGAWQVIEFY